MPYTDCQETAVVQRSSFESRAGDARRHICTARAMSSLSFPRRNCSVKHFAGALRSWEGPWVSSISSQWSRSSSPPTTLLRSRTSFRSRSHRGKFRVGRPRRRGKRLPVVGRTLLAACSWSHLRGNTGNRRRRSSLQCLCPRQASLLLHCTHQRVHLKFCDNAYAAYRKGNLR